MNLDSILAAIPKHIPLTLDSVTMNTLLQEAIAGQENISEASIVCEDGCLRLTATLMLAGTRMLYTTRLGLDEVTLSPERRVISLRRLEPDNLSGNGPMSILMAWFINIILCGLFRMDVAASSLSTLDGLVIEKGRITADLDKIGLTSKVQQAAAEQVTQFLEQQAHQKLPGGFKGIAARVALGAALPILAQKASELVLQKIQVTNLRISAADGLSGNLMLATSESTT